MQKADDVIGPEVEKLVAALPNGGVLLLENVRFYKEEEKNDPEFAQKLASLADLYVNDAFGTAHRAHASTEGVTKFLKPSVAGFLLQKVIFLFLCLHVPFCNSGTMKDGIKGKKMLHKTETCDYFLFRLLNLNLILLYLTKSICRNLTTLLELFQALNAHLLPSWVVQRCHPRSGLLNPCWKSVISFSWVVV